MGGKEGRKANIFNYGMESNTSAQSLIFCETVKKTNKQTKHCIPTSGFSSSGTKLRFRPLVL